MTASRHRARPSGTPSSSDESAVADDAGFSVIEVMVSFAILMVVLAAVIFALVGGSRITGVTQERVAANNIAREHLESLRVKPWTAIDAAASPSPTPQTQNNYHVCWSARSVTASGPTWTPTSTACPATDSTNCGRVASGNSYYLSVWVTWQTSSGLRSVRNDTVMAC